jgi:glycosyltransferase involved in cell wall biosynthesis
VSQRIIVANSQVPFVRGGSEVAADALVEQLRLRGHEVELVQLPLRWYPKEEIIKSYLAWRLVNLEESEGRPVDRLIALKFPAFVAQHPLKITWLIQQFRQVYDLFGTEFSDYTHSAADMDLRRAIFEMDARAIGESRRRYAIARNPASRLTRYNGLEAEVLYLPPAQEGRYRNEGYGDTILSVSRLDRLKRVDHLVRAMVHVRTPVRCCIVGRGAELDALQHLARRVGSAGRIDFLGYVSDDDLISAYAGALAVYYAPYDEDYGLATVEAMKSGKPVLTTTGSGGVLEFVEDRATGFVTPADDPVALARRIDELYEDRALAERLGIAAQQRVAPITWEATIAKLLI